MHQTILFAGGPITDYEWLSADLAKQSKPHQIICADSGYYHAKQLGLKPDIVCGDFDSIHPESLKALQNEAHVQVIHDPDQNSTDFQKSIAHIPDEHNITVYGATYGRIDHFLGLVFSLEKFSNPDRIEIRGQTSSLRLLTKDYTFNGKIGEMIGIIPFRPIQNLSYTGLKYQANTLGPPYDLGWIGTSNELIATHAKIHIDSGAALFIHERIL